jgi:hypothetical protein
MAGQSRTGRELVALEVDVLDGFDVFMPRRCAASAVPGSASALSRG